jgi:uroporphyrin-III C-methyltransferase
MKGINGSSGSTRTPPTVHGKCHAMTDRHPPQPGKVTIVGAGPGAHDLITVRGLAAVREADVVCYDALVSPSLLDQAPPGAERIYVGKRCGQHSIKQEEINRTIVEKARRGKTVVRLKGGDPLFFGRGGEEALACAEAGVEFEIVPGVCSATGAGSHAGIPLTYRGLSSSVAFVTAHGARSGQSPDLDWIRLATHVDTLVIYMGATWLGKIAAALIDAGVPGSRPAAVVSKATESSQVTVRGTVATIASRAAKAHVPTPALIVIGEVVRLSEVLNWFERQSALELAVDDFSRVEGQM